MRKPDRIAPGYTLIAPVGGRAVYWVDATGAVARRLELPWRIAHVEQLASGHLLGLTRGRVFEVDETGQPVWTYRPSRGVVHHDVLRTDRDTTLVIVQVWNEALGLWEDRIEEVDASGRIVWEWSALDHLDPERDREQTEVPHRNLGGNTDWLHANSLSLFRDRDLLVSLRNLNRIVRLDYPSGEIVWSWGQGVLGHQHSAQVLPNGHVLVFDNGFHVQPDRMCPSRPCSSRVLEIDPETREIVWEYRNPAFFSHGFGDADRLPNGNTLITYGQQTPAAVVLEVTPAGEEVWRLVTRLAFRAPLVFGEAERAVLYRSQRVTAVPHRAGSPWQPTLR